jgi:hypothetical protein
VQVGSHQREGHQGHRQARQGDEFGYSRTRCVAWSATPETLIEEVGRLPSVVRELELSTARRAVHRVLAMIESHYQGLDRTTLSGGWAPGVSNDQCDKLEVDCAAFTRKMACRIEGSGVATTKRVRDPKSSRAHELNMPQTILL